jgi:membrane-associated phospholipid phosphatase
MVLAPTKFDLWFIAKLASLLGRHPSFDLSVQHAIQHHVMGGFWFAAALFVYLVEGGRPGREKTRCRMLITLIGSALAITLCFCAGFVVSWLPPSRYPDLARFYPGYLDPDPNINSFPSQSTALYSAVAAGVRTESKLVGAFLGLMVVVLVALPRMYVGGHYPSDILAGVVLGLVGSSSAFYFLEPRLAPWVEKTFDAGGRWRVLIEIAAFIWILQIAVEFADVLWLRTWVLAWFQS